MAKELTPKQEAFVAAYLGEANYNATQAARTAGYSSPKASGTENLANPTVKQKIREHLDSLKDTGLRIKERRVEELADMDERLKLTMLARADEFKQRKAVDGEPVPPGGEYGMLVETIKVGPRGNVSEYVVDKHLISERRALIEQIAKELGEDNTNLNITVDRFDASKSARDKLLLSLFNDEDVKEEDDAGEDGTDQTPLPLNSALDE